MLRFSVCSLAVLCCVIQCATAASVQNSLLSTSTANSVTFYLYNKLSQYGTYESGRQLFTGNISTLDDTGIDPSKRLIILVHGYLQTYQCGFPQDIKDSYLKLGEGASVIAVDYGGIACANATSQLAQVVCFPIATLQVGTVGQAVSDLLTAIVQKGLATPDKIHLIGVSLGVHVAGEAGNRFYKANGKRIQRISGLDPSGPSITCDSLIGRCLSMNDAVFVDVLHTDMGGLGTTQALGDIDIYANGGTPPQPTCEGQQDLCSHLTSAEYWLQTIGRSDVIATQCGSYQDYTSGLCSNGTTSVFGDSATPGPTGSFYLSILPVPFTGRYTCFN